MSTKGYDIREQPDSELSSKGYNIRISGQEYLIWYLFLFQTWLFARMHPVMAYKVIVIRNSNRKGINVIVTLMYQSITFI